MSNRLTTASYLVLGMVEMLQPASPYDIKSYAAESVSGFWTLPHTQIYAQCDKLVEQGLLHQEQEQHGRRRRFLTVTDEGRAALREWREDTSYVEHEAHDIGALRVFLGVPPEQVAPEMVRGHEAALAKYRGFEKLPDLPPNVRTVLEAGIVFRTGQLEFWSQFLDQAAQPTT